MSAFRKFSAVAVGASALVMVFASQAAAGSGEGCGGDGHCLRFSFNSDQGGSQTYLWGSNIPDLASYKFLTLGGGEGYSLKNHAASAANFSPYPATVYFNSNYAGSCDTLSDYAYADKLHNTYNNNASVRFNYSGSGCYKF
ncbi:hypothetical protein [Streptomyces sp. LN785]|uniref:hypothetical protein n=1 Tax=Streptomyces sp. LN785 TaxID=3112983 RepID=UPI003715E6B8